jgi:hypothetical protein
MRRLVGRIRVLLPPSAFVVLYAFVYLVASVPALVIARRFGPAAVDAKLRQFPATIHLVGMVLYGVYRAVAFHPFFRAGYRRWLETTPWSWGKPLPVGPAHPVAGDALIVAAAGLPEWLAGDVHPIASYAMALGGYLMALSATFAKTGAWGFSYPVLFGLGLAVALGRGPVEYPGAAVLASYAIAMVGLRRSFRHWPWPDLPVVVPDATKGFVIEGKPGPLGWPFDRLGPRHDAPMTRRDAAGKLLAALVAGWWCYALECVLGAPGQFFVRGMLLTNGVFILSIGRLAEMISGHAPPISLAGRLARLRPIIPSYDQIFLAPAAAIFTAVAGPTLLERGGLPADVAIAACASLALMAIWLGGPDRRAWQLTARHRITPGLGGAGKANEFVQTG